MLHNEKHLLLKTNSSMHEVRIWCTCLWPEGPQFDLWISRINLVGRSKIAVLACLALPPLRAGGHLWQGMPKSFSSQNSLQVLISVCAFFHANNVFYCHAADLGLDRGEGAEHPSAAVDSKHCAVGGWNPLEACGHGWLGDAWPGEEVLQEGCPDCPSR